MRGLSGVRLMRLRFRSRSFLVLPTLMIGGGAIVASGGGTGRFVAVKGWGNDNILHG